MNRIKTFFQKQWQKLFSKPVQYIDGNPWLILTEKQMDKMVHDYRMRKATWVSISPELLKYLKLQNPLEFDRYKHSLDSKDRILLSLVINDAFGRHHRKRGDSNLGDMFSNCRKDISTSINRDDDDIIDYDITKRPFRRVRIRIYVWYQEHKMLCRGVLATVAILSMAYRIFF